METYLEKRILLNSRFKSPKPALFLDRDGVLIQDKHYLSEINQIEICLGATQLIKKAKDAGWSVIVITNQSGISRGFFSWDDYERVSEKLIEMLGPNSSIDGIYANGYAPKTSSGTWRKPDTGMLTAAKKDLNINLESSILVGDRLSDLQAGTKAGLSIVIHVLTGHGTKERPEIIRNSKEDSIFIFEELSSRLILIKDLLDFPTKLFI